MLNYHKVNDEYLNVYTEHGTIIAGIGVGIGGKWKLLERRTQLGSFDLRQIADKLDSLNSK